MTTATPTSTRSTRTDLRTLPDALESEWIKLSSLRATRIILVLTAVVNVLTAWAVSETVTDEVLTVSRVFVYPAVFTAVLAAISGILMFTAEVQHGTLATTMAAQPARWVIVVGKAAAAGGMGVVLGVIGMAAAFGASVASGLKAGDTSTITATALCALLFTALTAAIGLGVGMCVRHTAGAISGLLVWWFVVENLLLRFTPPELGRFVPFDAGYRLLQVGGAYETPDSIAVALGRPELAFVFGSYAAVALVVGTVLLYRRDTN